ncbi:UNVERIFIED_CONTAM: hypothetical protein Sangu_2602300 [Sesamum angustifolium]|uniref:Uncharacterized protein n=1 Tax=Sesamum angustifolium TaxID=2727405 RepID=A0AAW2J534_9LAMI
MPLGSGDFMGDILKRAFVTSISVKGRCKSSAIAGSITARRCSVPLKMSIGRGLLEVNTWHK